MFCYHNPFHYGRLLRLCVMKRILDASLLRSVNVCLLIEVLHTPGIYNLARSGRWWPFSRQTCSAFHNFLLWLRAHKAFHVYPYYMFVYWIYMWDIWISNVFIFVMFNELKPINRIFFYIGGISDRHCLNLVLDVTKLYEIYFSHTFWLWEQHTVLSFSP